MKQTFTLEQSKKGINKFIVLFCTGFLVGIVIGNFFIPTTGGEAGIMSAYFLDKFEYMEIEYSSLFVYILERRMKIYWLLTILGITGAGCIAAWGYTIWLGISTGAFLSICILRMGIIGILVGTASLFPHYLFYVPVYVLLIWRISENAEMIRSNSIQHEKKKIIGKYFLIMALVSLILLVGIVLESNVNPYLMKKVLKLV